VLHTSLTPSLTRDVLGAQGAEHGEHTEHAKPSGISASPPDFSVRLAEYKLDLKAYQQNGGKVRLAMSLLAF
jgi:hypothetical protein